MLTSISKWKGFVIKSWHIGKEHIHLYISISPKYSVSYAVNILKGKSSSWIKKKAGKLPQGSIWNRGYFVTTLGIDEYIIKRYVESHGKRLKDVVIKMDLKPALAAGGLHSEDFVIHLCYLARELLLQIWRGLR